MNKKRKADANNTMTHLLFALDAGEDHRATQTKIQVDIAYSLTPTRSWNNLGDVGAPYVGPCPPKFIQDCGPQCRSCTG